MVTPALDKELSLSIPRVDREHGDVLQAVRWLRVAVESGRPKIELRKLLDDLIDLVEAHFASEEEMMRSNEYAEQGPHALEHNRLLGQIREVRGELESGAIKACGAFSAFVEAWTRQHIVGPDRRFAEYLKQRAA